MVWNLQYHVRSCFVKLVVWHLQYHVRSSFVKLVVWHLQYYVRSSFVKLVVWHLQYHVRSCFVKFTSPSIRNFTRCIAIYWYITNWYCELQNIRESSSYCLNEIIFPYLKINLYLKIIKTYLKDNVLYNYSITCFNMIIYMVGNNRGSWCSLKKSCRFFTHFVINVKSWIRTPERFWHCAGLVKFWCLTPLSTIFQLYRGGQLYWWYCI